MPSKNSTWEGLSQDDNWERDVLNRLAFATLNEQRRNRKWRVFFMLLFFIYIFLIYATILEPDWHRFIGENDETASADTHTALIEVQGIIASETEASADQIVSGLRKAFKDNKTKGVILRINSPGVVQCKLVISMMKFDVCGKNTLKSQSMLWQLIFVRQVATI
ncbi:Peptidase S49 [Beggiatoa sp. PS]|nr:Peptidase S49 [Beggiatoa sp. PS]